MQHSAWTYTSCKRALAAPVLGAAALFVCALSLLLLCLYLTLKPDLTLYQERSRLLYDTEGSIIAHSLSDDGRLRFLSKPDEVDPLLIKLILAAEDERFYEHPGVDAIALGRAALSNLLSLQRVSGASTLDMQCIRLLEKRPRTYRSKVVEMIKAVKLRRMLSPEGVLTLYLTLCPYGSRIEGVQAAALSWFGHDAQKLTPAEAALLAALPRAPELLRPDRHLQRAMDYRSRVLARALELGFIDLKSAQAAAAEPLPTEIRPIAQPGFYLGKTLFAKAEPRELHTTIKPKVQQVLLEIADNFNQQHGGENKADLDLAMVVLDNVSHEVAGCLGGRGALFNELDLTQAVRSPGSALKPFAYAQAMERHLLHPNTLIYDDSQGFVSYQPLNFNRAFSGFVTAKEALVRSLNVPAVKILQRLTPHVFYAFLNQGTAKDHPRVVLPKGAQPSLPLILGGAGITLFDLTELYSIFGSEGRLYPAALLSGQSTLPELSADPAGKAKKGIALLSPDTALALRAMLRLNPPPENYSSVPIAYKTGTSYNFTDALSLGLAGRYTIGVWTGRRSGKSNYPETGRSAAAPILFETVRRLSALMDVSDRPEEVSRGQALLAAAAPPYLKFFDVKESAASSGFSGGADAGSSTLSVIKSLTGPQFVFPKDNALLYARAGDEIYLEAAGGSAPYVLLVDGTVQPQLSFTVSQVPGFYELILLDAEGRSCTITIRVTDGSDGSGS